MNKTAEERITQSRVRLLLTKPFFGQLAVRLKIEDASSFIYKNLHAHSLIDSAIH